jgi:hypothetical protein
MLKLLEATINSPIVDDAVFREAKQYLSDRQMVELYFCRYVDEEGFVVC